LRCVKRQAPPMSEHNLTGNRPKGSYPVWPISEEEKGGKGNLPTTRDLRGGGVNKNGRKGEESVLDARTTEKTG